MSSTNSRRQRHGSTNRGRETPHVRHSSSSSISSSDYFESADEEARMGGTPRAGGKQWTMRSVSKGSGGRTNDYSSTRQDDYSDDGYGSSEDEKPKKPSSKKKGGYPASDASYDSDPDQNPSKRGKASANTGKGDDDDDDQQEEEKENGNSKKWWWIGGLAAILVALLIIGGMYLWNRSNSAASDGSASSGAANSTSLAPSSAATDSSASTLDQTTTALDSTTSQSTTESLTSSPSKTKNAETQKPSPTPSKTQPDPAPLTTYAAQITWFHASKEVSECGSKASNDNYVVRVSPELYGDPESVSPLCGTWISLYQLEKDSMVRATIEGISPNMTGHNLDLSRKVFQALTSNLKLGTTLAQWWLTEEKHRPSASLSSAAAAPTGKGDKAPGGGGKEKGEEEEGTVTIATAPNPPLETGGGSLHEEELSPNGISETNDY
ncbi:hypothetical protein JCM8115_003027 [Rhodotorula mucilaginosa]